jgi:hypothetical protein
MITSFINETADHELHLADLQNLNGAMPVLIALAYTGTGLMLGMGGFAVNEWFQENREDIADAVHDAISEEDDAD